MSKIAPQTKNGRLIPIMDKLPAPFPDERWLDIPNYEGIYQISNYGRVKTYDQHHTDKNGVVYFRKGKLRTISIYEDKKVLFASTKDERYLNISTALTKDKVKRTYPLARLVYYTFIAPFDLEDQTVSVARKDKDYLNCHVSNLKLVTVKERINHEYQFEGRKSGWHTKIRPIHQYSMEGVYIQTHASVTIAGKHVNIAATAVCAAALKKDLLSGQCYWRYGKPVARINVSAFRRKREKYAKTMRKKVEQLDKEGKIIATYNSISAAAKAVQSKSTAGIRYACAESWRTSMGFHWRLAKD